MPTEAGRHRLYEKVKEQWGEQNADELMSYLPPVGWADVATKGDLAILRTDLDALRAANKQDLALLSAELRGETSELRGELGIRIEALRAEMHKGFAAIETRDRSNLRWIIAASAGFSTIVTAIVTLAG
jgi:hypothetical protein